MNTLITITTGILATWISVAAMQAADKPSDGTPLNNAIPSLGITPVVAAASDFGQVPGVDRRSMRGGGPRQDNQSFDPNNRRNFRSRTDSQANDPNSDPRNFRSRTDNPPVDANAFRRSVPSGGRGGPSGGVGNMAPDPSGEFQKFKLVYERNIFDPNRRPPRLTPTITPPPTRIDAFTFVGTGISADITYAFFDSSDPNYRKALKVSETIAGFKLTDIAPDCVTLTSLSSTNSRTVQLYVLMQMRRQDEGEWQTSGSRMTVAELSSTGDFGLGGAAEEIIKKLMQKREQEMGKEIPPADTATTAAEPAPATEPAPSDAASNDSPVDEVMKRLMQKREQENKQ